MTPPDTARSEAAESLDVAKKPREEVLQVERRDFVELVPEGRKRVQPMQGFDRSTPTSSITSCAAPTASGTSATSG